MPITDVAIRLRSGKEGNRIGYDSAADLLDEIAAKDAIIRERDKEIATLRTDRHDELATLRTKLATAHAALEPFVRYLKWAEAYGVKDDPDDSNWFHDDGGELTAGEFRAARKTLKDTAHD